jgi:TnpA family transposase
MTNRAGRVPAKTLACPAYRRRALALTRPVRWDIVAEQYDQMIKYATAIRAGTASTDCSGRTWPRTARLSST